MKKDVKERYLKFVKESTIATCRACNSFWDDVVFSKLNQHDHMESFVFNLLQEFIDDVSTECIEEYAVQICDYWDDEDTYVSHIYDTVKMYQTAIKNAYCTYAEYKDDIDQVDVKDNIADMHSFVVENEFYDYESLDWSMIYDTPETDKLNNDEKKQLQDLLNKIG